MEKYIYNEKTDLHYELIGDYYYPRPIAPERACVGIWGMRQHRYLREHRKITYTTMPVTDKLNPHLEEVDRQAEERRQIYRFLVADTLSYLSICDGAGTAWKGLPSVRRSFS